MKTAQYQAEVYARLNSMAHAARAHDPQESASEAFARWLENGANGDTVEQSARMAARATDNRMRTKTERTDKRHGMEFMDMTTEGTTGPNRRHANARFPQAPEVWTGLESLNRDDARELATIGRLEGGNLRSAWLESCGVGGPDEPTILERPRAAGRPRGEDADKREAYKDRERARLRDAMRARRAAARMAAQRAREASERAAAN